ncbi:MAG: hypothetical protein ABW075_04280 [Aeromicrobium sp.]
MTAIRRTEKPNPWGAAGALVGIVALVGSMFLAELVAGHLTEALLGSLDMLGPDAYYTGTPMVLEPALWLVALLYSVPVVVAAWFISIDDLLGSGWSPARLIAVALALVGLVASVGIIWFAFDPSRSGHHEPLIRRWEAFSYEAADLVFAATWVMIAMAAVLVVTRLYVSRRAVRLPLQLVAFLALTATLGTLFA